MIQYPQHRWRLLDRPPELIIGPAKGRTHWQAMTGRMEGGFIRRGLSPSRTD
jgi:hypothetical protein